jgi:hypothetical protein
LDGAAMTANLNVKVPEVAVALPFGFTAHFRFCGGLTIGWTPHMPAIKSPRARRKFMEAYVRARNEYMQVVATAIGGRVMILDGISPADISQAHVADPAERH